ncbi:MAG: BamA/TamA family outer membrane protein [Ignavibacteria bacterium]|jgi:outer membrane protein insertion porin family|nr:BamA/TamA family outer membrane protein [Ignavibacteria bacterium]MCU7504170.1 BamA/TamA family outer membrane protein [Ignavibacteria bacterium]MCU7516380.1 BamA/TamA family outer membrane protein [Ignavibacteria bacterium]
MNRKLVLAFILIVFLPAAFFSQQVIGRIDVTGSVFSRTEYVNWSGVRTGMKVFPSILDTVKLNLTKKLSEMGYYHPSFEGTGFEASTDASGADLRIAVRPGNPTYVRNIEIESAGADSAYFMRLFGFMKGQVFVKPELEDNLSSSLDYLQEKGFPFAKVIISSIFFTKDTASSREVADLFLKIDKGLVTKIDEVKIKGNTKTSDRVILRELRIKPGSLYSQKLIEQVPQRLDRLRFFEPLEEPSYYLNSKGEGVLLINVKEKQTNNFDGILGYLPGTGEGQKGYLTGLVNVTLRNILGSGRAAAIKWQQLDRYSQDLELRYLEPWLFSFPFNVNLGLIQHKQDTTYIQRRYEASLEYLATEDISASVVLSTEDVIPTENGSPYFTVFNSSTVSTGVSLKIDTRDDFYAPTKGIYFLNSYLFSRKKVNGPERFLNTETIQNINQQRFAIDFSLFYEIFSSQVAALGLHGRELRSTNYEVSDLYRFGGTNTLRGYNENQFLANRLLWSNLEYRVLLSRRTYGFLFLDSGYYLRSAEPERNIPRTSSFKNGYGLGINLETGFGILSVSYALGNGDQFSQGKIHLGLVNEF